MTMKPSQRVLICPKGSTLISSPIHSRYTPSIQVLHDTQTTPTPLRLLLTLFPNANAKASGRRKLALILVLTTERHKAPTVPAIPFAFSHDQNDRSRISVSKRIIIVSCYDHPSPRVSSAINPFFGPFDEVTRLTMTAFPAHTS